MSSSGATACVVKRVGCMTVLPLPPVSAAAIFYTCLAPIANGPQSVGLKGLEELIDSRCCFHNGGNLSDDWTASQKLNELLEQAERDGDYFNRNDWWHKRAKNWASHNPMSKAFSSVSTVAGATAGQFHSLFNGPLPEGPGDLPDQLP